MKEVNRRVKILVLLIAVKIQEKVICYYINTNLEINCILLYPHGKLQN